MTEITTYFQSIPPSHRSSILFGGIAFFWAIESIIPLFKFNYNKTHHASINLFFTFTTIIINFFLAFLLFDTANWTTQKHFGILYWLNIENLALKMIFGLLLMDFIGAYLAHYVQHKTKILWKMHLIHHTDTWLDTTSANRHHPLESIIRFLFTWVAIFSIGAPVWLFFMYQSTSVLLSQFNHANIKLPQSLDTWISYFLVSPNMHKVHHHYQLPYTDSNYGNIFSVWDRLFGTFRTLPTNQIVYGIDTHPNEKEHNQLINLLKIPLQKYRHPST
ncbi:sterol desaturase family protein [Flavobacterium sp.]|uniref:sterol desaturase family protein n=1 Tax=Flavobacterium sp. TaxID=239 RepID=UPI003D1330F8